MEEEKNTPIAEADTLSEEDIVPADAPQEERQTDDGIKNAEDLTDEDIVAFEEPPKPKKRILEEKVDTSKPEIDAEDYDIHIPLRQPEDADARIAGKTPVRVVYDMNGAEVEEGLKYFHKLTLYKKNLVYTIILFVIFCLYVYRITTETAQGAPNSLQYFLAALCVALIAFLWYMPRRHIKTTKQAVANERMTFTVDVYDSCLMVGELEHQQMVDFETPKPRVIAFETALNFCIGVGKERIFILPKRCLNGSEDAVRACLKQGFGERMKDYTA